MEWHWDPMKGERLGPAWRAGLALLHEHEWCPWIDLAQAMADASDIQWVTAKQLVYTGLKEGALEKRGQYDQKTRRDTRMVRLTRAGRERWSSLNTTPSGGAG